MTIFLKLLQYRGGTEDTVCPRTTIQMPHTYLQTEHCKGKDQLEEYSEEQAEWCYLSLLQMNGKNGLGLFLPTDFKSKQKTRTDTPHDFQIKQLIAYEF